MKTPTSTTTPATQSENDQLKAENEELRQRLAAAGENSAEVRAKMSAGLTREQALVAIKNQKNFTELFARRQTAPVPVS